MSDSESDTSNASLSERFGKWVGQTAGNIASSYRNFKSSAKAGYQQTSDTSSQSGEPSEQSPSEAADSGLTVGYLLHLARVLTSDARFLNQETSSEDLLGIQSGPTCDESSADLQKNPYFELINSLTSDPPTYTGENPIQDIVNTISQLQSCEQSNSTLLSKIGDFFMRRDAGKTLKGLLLSADVVIKCLSLWYVMQQNGLLDSPNSLVYRSLQQFCQDAIGQAHSIVGVDEIPPTVSKLLPTVQEWDGRLETVQATFQVGSIYPAPVLLIFNPEALEQVMEATANGGQLPEQVPLDNGTSVDADSLPMIFLPRTQVSQVARDYLASGRVKPAT